ncbi:glycosyltransferase family 4 protein [uncultured Cetobacterium sp.]|uniref:glycosyltransferase family 4 protein n=2 Tax=Cetobacterium TaxID=180162 RepID=UPI00260C2AEB|nr:glycosyltransferase family 4 protein [uncultured Cetobacterium sp.]
MKKVLIWNDYPLGPVGGPSGYLYNLKSYIEENNIKNIDFLNNEDFIKKVEIKKEKKFEAIRKIIREFKKQLFKTKKLEKRINKFYKFYEGDYSFINNYDIVHFHDVRSFYRAKNILKDFKGITLLSSHCPKTPAQEEIEDNIKMDYKTFPKKLRERLEKIDQDSFKNADYLVFPCKEAQEPYEEDKNIKEILEEKYRDKKILYVPTGIPVKHIDKDEKFFSNKGIDVKDKFIVSYIGRHNKVKGYDFLKELGVKVLEKYSDVIFVIGGEISEEFPPIENKNWVEFGWTKEGYNIIKNSDMFVLPNEKTYFDLILLEVLSMGAPVLLSETGGNKYFKIYDENGLFYFEKYNLEEALEKFDETYNLWKNRKLSLEGEKNYRIFKKDFTVNTFGENYTRLYNEVK